MKSNEIIKTFLFLFFSIVLLSCSGTKESQQNVINTNEIKTEYESSLEALNTSGGYFSVSKDDKNTLILSFDELNQKIKDSEDLASKISLMSSVVKAMEDFIVKSNELLNNNELSSSERSEVFTKKNMVESRIEQANKLLSKYVKEKLTAEKLAIEEEHRKKEKPYFLKIYNKKVHLCTSDNMSQIFANIHNKRISGHRARLAITKSILCSNKETIDKFDINLNDEQRGSLSFNTGLYLEKSNMQERLVRIEELSLLNNQLLFTQPENEENNESEVVLKLGLFQLFASIDTNLEITFDISSFIKNEFFRNNKTKSLLSHFYSRKQDILGQLQDKHLIRLLNDQFELANMRTTDEIIKFVKAQDYEQLRKYASSLNSNKVSYNSDLKITDYLTAYGLSPLMVAALLDDVESIEILLSIDGINPNYESPVFKRRYTTISSISRETLTSIQSTSHSDSGSSSFSHTSRKNKRYSGFTSLMIAVDEGNCDLVDAILEVEPETINYETSSGKTALYVATHNTVNFCLDSLLKAGAFDVRVFERMRDILNVNPKRPFYKKDVSSMVQLSDFFKNIDDKIWKESKTIKDVKYQLLYTRGDLETKKELLKRVPLTVQDIKPHFERKKITIETRRTSDWSGRKYVSIDYLSSVVDYRFAKMVNLDLATEKVIGKSGNKETVFNYVYKRINKLEDSELIEKGFRKFLYELYDINSQWVIDWLNSNKSFEGQNPLVAATMYNEVGLVKALLSFKDINVNIVDNLTGYNAYEWNYSVNTFSNIFSVQGIADMLQDNGAKIRASKANLLGKPNSRSKENMLRILGQTNYPFSMKSSSSRIISQ